MFAQQRLERAIAPGAVHHVGQIGHRHARRGPQPGMIDHGKAGHAVAFARPCRHRRPGCRQTARHGATGDGRAQPDRLCGQVGGIAQHGAQNFGQRVGPVVGQRLPLRGRGRARRRRQCHPARRQAPETLRLHTGPADAPATSATRCCPAPRAPPTIVRAAGHAERVKRAGAVQRSACAPGPLRDGTGRPRVHRHPVIVRLPRPFEMHAVEIQVQPADRRVVPGLHRLIVRDLVDAGSAPPQTSKRPSTRRRPALHKPRRQARPARRYPASGRRRPPEPDRPQDTVCGSGRSRPHGCETDGPVQGVPAHKAR